MTITFRAGIPTQPWLCRHDPKKTYNVPKLYRGRMEKCIPPRWSDGLDCVPMNLVFSSSLPVSFSYTNFGRSGVETSGLPDKCFEIRPLALAKYNSSLEGSSGVGNALVVQGFNLPLPWAYQAQGVRLFAPFVMPDIFGGFSPDKFVGCSFDATGSRSSLFPGAGFSVTVLGRTVFFIPPLVLGSLSFVLPSDYFSGFHYDVSVTHAHYLSMPSYPSCENGGVRIFATAYVQNVKLLVGEKYVWTYTFTPPYYDNWWICYPDLQGGLLPIYPVGDKTEIVA